MPLILDEIDANFQAFSKRWQTDSVKNSSSLSANPVYLESYRRITCLQALKVYIVEQKFSSGSALFFFEAHNDALVSHVNASIGGWRSALQSLRSCIENALSALYYADHPVELTLWSNGQHRLTVAELFKYFEKHPKLVSLSENVTGVPALRSEYGVLSKAVHGSAANFRMTDSSSTVLLWNDDMSRASMWAARERKALEAISLIVVALNAELLQGAALSPVRDILSLSIGPTGRRLLKQDLHIHIPNL